MSHNKMLIDATHPEETRVVVLRNSRVEEFDFESATRKLLRGNIYLAKVTRVEPSLQAAFIDYGGNRHGFLAFNEIHPDYYTIPVADRQALLDEEAAADAAEEAEADRRAEARASRGADDNDQDDAEDQAIDVSELLPPETIEPIGPGGLPADATDSRDQVSSVLTDPHDAPVEFSSPGGAQAAPETADHDGHAALSADGEATPAAVEAVEVVGSEDTAEEMPTRPRRRARSYKIQEVIKRRQIILVQIVKEERGTKGAALTTYLSLAGRYTVLMPNTARGGGISRKITNAQDRKRLKAIAQELDVPEGMGLIIRTAGAARTSQEIKRDFEYLLRLWENVRDMTLQSTAPSLVYEEGDLIKRSIRDLYTKEIDEVVVAGSAAHREARDFMRMLMPSHAKNVIDYRDPEPLFNKYQIEKQLNAMFSPFVNLRSGGYLVINQTEALVAIDINSGKSTREFSIEETALNTNLEAADEIARQLKLRDLAGLIVIDFIDMEEKRNNRAVERRIKDALRFDRARIQVGRISHFGLLEMSRQRLRTGVLEGSTTQCPHCQGTGIIRSTESVALAVIRALEDTLIANGRSSLVATTSAGVALYILNHKRAFIVDMEHRYGVSVTVQASDKVQGSNFTIEKSNLPLIAARRPDKAAVNMDWGFDGENDAPSAPEAQIEEVETDEPDDVAVEVREPDDATNGEAPRGRKRRRRRGGRRDDRGDDRGEQRASGSQSQHADEDERPSRQPTGELEELGDNEDAVSEGNGRHEARDGGSGDRSSERGERGAEGGNDAGGARRGRRRGRRGGRRGGRDREPMRASDGSLQNGSVPDGSLIDGAGQVSSDLSHAADQAKSALEPGSARAEFAEHDPHSHPRNDGHAVAEARPSNGGIEAHAAAARPEPAVEPREAQQTRVAGTEAQASVEPPTPVVHAEPTPVARAPVDGSSATIAVVSSTPDDDKPARKGWWQRRFSGE